MIRLDIVRREIASVVLAGFLSFVLAVPVFAWQAEGGTLNCGQFVSYTHARYNDIAAIQGPGGPTSYYNDDDNLWHTREVTGSYSGDWLAVG